MTSPFDKVRNDSDYGGPPFAKMQPGETRHATSKDRGNFQLTRTTRPFIDDFVDCQNDRYAERLKEMGMVWVVDPHGKPKLKSTRQEPRRLAA